MRATQHALLIIGEAANSLGNFLRHEYARIDDRLIWDIVENHLHPLDEAVENLLASLQRDTS